MLPTAPTEPDLQALFTPFLKDIRTKNTRASYANGLAALLRFIDETKHADHSGGSPYPLSLMTNTILADYFRWLSDNFSPYTVNTYLAALQRFLVWLDAAEQLPLNCHLGNAQSRLKAVRGNQKMRYKSRRPDPALPRIVTYYDSLPLPERSFEHTPAQAKKTHQARLTLLRNRAIVHTLYASAGRVSEVAQLTREQVLDGRIDEVQIVGKGDKERIILLTKQAQISIRAYLKERVDGSLYLFIGHGTRSQGKPINRTAVWKIVKAAAKALDLHSQTSPHAFRHYRATQLLNEGMPLELVQAYLGHESVATTRKIYAHTHTAVLKEQFQRFDRAADEVVADLDEAEADD